MPKKTYVYVDGFNLYYGCLKGTKYKWLDLFSLCQKYLPDSTIAKIYYCTAIVSGTAKNPNNHIRQRTYLRALKTIPCLGIIPGHFLSEPMWLPRADNGELVRVIRAKEKGTDVNLATQLICDAYEDKFETAVLVTGDLDFISPVKIVRNRLGKEVGVLDPQRSSGSRSKLTAEANFSKPIRDGALTASQFDLELTDANGKFYKPQEWF